MEKAWARVEPEMPSSAEKKFSWLSDIKEEPKDDINMLHHTQSHTMVVTWRSQHNFQFIFCQKKPLRGEKSQWEKRPTVIMEETWLFRGQRQPMKIREQFSWILFNDPAIYIHDIGKIKIVKFDTFISPRHQILNASLSYIAVTYWETAINQITDMLAQHSCHTDCLSTCEINPSTKHISTSTLWPK